MGQEILTTEFPNPKLLPYGLYHPLKLLWEKPEHPSQDVLWGRRCPDLGLLGNLKELLLQREAADEPLLNGPPCCSTLP